MALAYYGVQLSDRWTETPEGYIICKNAVIARTGFQRYKGRELDKVECEQQGITLNDEDDVDMYRSPDEVFSPKTIASFQLKSITEGHPPKLLTVDDVQEYEEGQITNVRKGNEALESGDWPLLADLVIKTKNLIDKIRAGLRQLSCGYNYHVLKQGNLIKQVDIVGNHVAIVETARAGPEASIRDSAITSPERDTYIMSFLDKVLNSNRKGKLAEWAKTAKPEDVAEAMDSMAVELDKREAVAATALSIAKDETKVATDAANDAAKDRKRFHDAVDRMLDSNDAEQDAKDADLKELKDMFSKHGADAADESEEKEEKEEKKEESGEDALTIEPEDRPIAAGPGTDAADAIALRAEGAKAVLKSLKPFVAKSGDKKLIAAFDSAARTVMGKSKGNTSGGYGAVSTAANSRGKDAADSMENGSQALKDNLKSITDAEGLYQKRFTARQ